MNASLPTSHAPSSALAASLRLLELTLTQRLRQAFLGEAPQLLLGMETAQMRAASEEDAYARFVHERGLDRDAEVLLALGLAPWAGPDFLDRIIRSALPEAGEYPELGGVRGRQHRGFLPTGDTALFLLAGNDLEARFYWHGQLRGEHPLIQEHVLALDDAPDGEPPMSGRLRLDDDYAEAFLTGREHVPRTSHRFPAQRVETAMEWGDLVLSPRTLSQINELEQWISHGEVLMSDFNMRRKLRPGCRALFYGPPGTGKTLTASLLAKSTGRKLYKVDLSTAVSKYIGETEKNLGVLFDRAQHKNWILFFDEADALFGKRTQVRDSHDRYANQEVSFLLQRIETFDGLVILATNLATNVDEAFARRFEHVIHFPIPRQRERRLLWERGIPREVTLEAGLNVADLAMRHELSGATIMNVLRHACLQSVVRGDALLREEDVSEGIRRELAKENRLQ